MRAYDTRVARFFAVDPIAKDYPELTPYQFASNTPIQAVDLDGLEAAFVIAEGRVAVPLVGFFGLTGSAFGGVVMDVHGNVGAMYGVGGGVSGGVDAFGGIQVGINPEARTINDLIGWGANAGVVIGAGVGVSAELNQAIATDANNRPDLRDVKTGVNINTPSVGALGAAGYGEVSYTWVDYYGNAFKGANDLYDNLMKVIEGLGIDPAKIGVDTRKEFDDMIKQLQGIIEGETKQNSSSSSPTCTGDDCR
jgi:hypothetical protein